MSLEQVIQNQSEQISQLTKTINQLLTLPSLIPRSIHKEEEEMPKKLKYGQGSIKKRVRINKKGTYTWYQIRWYDEYGKRHQCGRSTLKNAEKVLSENNSRSLKNKRKYAKTFGEYMDDWYNTYRINECGELRNSINLLQIKRIPIEIKDKPLNSVTALDLQKHINSIDCPNPRANTQQLLSAVLKYAFNSGHIKANIGMLLKAETPKAKPRQILPRELEEQFINAFPSKIRDYVVGLLYTGTRLGEFMRLNENWETDIDYENKKIKIRETKSLRQKDIRSGKTFIFREIPLLPQIANIKFPLIDASKFTLNKKFREAVAKLNDQNKELNIQITPHCLRHTFVSRCNEIGVAKSVIKEMVGHKTDRMMNHYTHNTTELLDKEFEKLALSIPISIPIQSLKAKNCGEKSENLVKKPA